VPLNSVCRHAIDEWTTARTDQVAAGAATSSPPAASAALWLSRSESRISARVIDSIIRRLAKDAHLELSAHTLRHTAVTNLIRLYSGSDNAGLE
jgi:site-specific recombinase XerD